MEETSLQWDKLRLSKSEKEEIEICNENLEISGSRDRSSLVGKLLMDCKISKEVLRSMMIKVWKVGSLVKFTEIQFNTFIICFVSFEEKDPIFPRHPWLFGNFFSPLHYLMVLYN